MPALLSTESLSFLVCANISYSFFSNLKNSTTLINIVCKSLKIVNQPLMKVIEAICLPSGVRTLTHHLLLIFATTDLILKPHQCGMVAFLITSFTLCTKYTAWCQE